MKTKKNLFIILIIAMFSISGCAQTDTPKELKYSYDLVDNFFLYKSNDDIVGIAIKSNDSNENEEKKKIILENISKVSWNENFILAEQIERIQLGKEEKKIYWIINSNTQQIYGPNEYEEFNNQRKELNIDENLELKSPDSYKK
ncbi:DUF3997 domain-containing protein [Senegalia massiliensis]|uniref:DUF3997 domain-containing protein n=1 Tax=Senegalia massiliensis TaxID=1720316 RepID=A0A845QTK9_9CLOT|nr:DUF3997 domain-containing protein [Senegalia massiliensis]NBI05875.1 DUF3997 domain-containing protein [Senegalia massiliensis]